MTLGRCIKTTSSSSPAPSFPLKKTSVNRSREPPRRPIDCAAHPGRPSPAEVALASSRTVRPCHAAT
eukprot:4171909-Pyramimonas_sp.AAC.1